MEVAIWLSLVLACVVAGLAYGRFTPAGCCGCSVECEECQSGTAKRSYTISITGMANQSCSSCSAFNGSFVVSLGSEAPTQHYGGEGCYHNNTTIDQQICTSAENDFYGIARWEGSGSPSLEVACFFQIGDGYPGFPDTAGKIFVWLSLRMSQAVGSERTLLYYATELTGTERSNALDCTADLDGLVLPYVGQAPAVPGNTRTACQWANATVTVHT